MNTLQHWLPIPKEIQCANFIIYQWIKGVQHLTGLVIGKKALDSFCYHDKLDSTKLQRRKQTISHSVII